MSTVFLILDKLRVTSLDDELDVSVNTSVSLFCPSRDIRTIESSQLLTLLRSGTLWVTRGSGYRLEFTTLFDEHRVDHQSRETVVQNLSLYLRDSTLWSQISLDAKVHLPHFGGNNNIAPSFTINLRHAFSTGPPLPSRSLQSPVAADVRAPVGIPCLKLEMVEICMKFSSSKVFPAGRSKADEYLRGLQTYSDSSNARKDSFAPLDQQNLSNSVFLDKRAIAMHENLRNDLFEDEEMLDGETISVQDYNLFSLPASQSSTASSLVSQSLQESQRECKGRSDQLTTTCLNVNSVERMAEFALRTLIGGRQTKSQPEFRVLKPYPGQNLSQIAPALWSPGFLDAVSQRSRFIPTISQVFSSSCLNNAVSPSLRRALADFIAENMTSPHVTLRKGCEDRDSALDDLGDSDQFDAVDDVIQCRIWKMMQLSLYDPLAARRLKPPQSENAQQIETLTEEPTIPDSTCKSCHIGDRLQGLGDDFSLFLDNEFDDLLDGTPEEADSDFEALFDDVESDVFEDLLDGNVQDENPDGFVGPGMDGSGDDKIERKFPTMKYFCDEWETDFTNFSSNMGFAADMGDEMQVDTQDMLL